MSADDQWAIRDVLAGYCHACDDNDPARLADLFALDAEYVVGDSVHAGREAIAAHFVEVAPIASVGKHLTSNAIVTLADSASASAISDWAYLVDGGELVVLAAGRYRDDFVKSSGSWLFARRQIEVFDRP